MSPNTKTPFMSEILDGLFVGDAQTSKSHDFMIKNKINFILNCSTDLENVFEDTLSIEYQRLSLEDHGREVDINNMFQALPSVVKELEERYKKGKNILIHCQAGAQRSATVAAAFLIHITKTTPEVATKHILKFRPNAFFFGEKNNFQQALDNFYKFNSNS